MKTARHHEARNFLRAHRAESRHSHPRRQTFQISVFRRTENLHPLLREIVKETGQRKTGPVDGRLTNLAIKAHALALEAQLQTLGVRIEKTLHRHDRHIFALLARRRDRLRLKVVGHQGQTVALRRAKRNA